MDLKYDRSRYFDIPRFFYFEVGNTTVGSSNTFNYRIAPGDGKLNVFVWYGEKCFELSEPADKNEFPLDNEGYLDVIYWIDEKYEQYLEKINSGELKGRRTYISR